MNIRIVLPQVKNNHLSVGILSNPGQKYTQKLQFSHIQKRPIGPICGLPYSEITLPGQCLVKKKGRFLFPGFSFNSSLCVK